MINRTESAISDRKQKCRATKPIIATKLKFAETKNCT